MAHFAKIENGVVREVIVIGNDVIGNGDHTECEEAGQAFIASCGLAGEWKMTSYNSNFRGVYAGIGFTYDADLDEFVTPAVDDDASA